MSQDTMIREFKEEIERLRKLLAERDAFSGAAGAPGGGVAAGGGALMADMLSMMAMASGGSSGGSEGSIHSAMPAHSAYGVQQAQAQHLGDTEAGVRPDYASPVKLRAPAMQVTADTPSAPPPPPPHLTSALRVYYVQDTEEAEYSPDKDHSAATGILGTMSPAERERSLREDVENRLHQLENMVSTPSKIQKKGSFSTRFSHCAGICCSWCTTTQPRRV